MSHRSTLAAHDRPSAMAHTIRLWPRVMSPHTNTAVPARLPIPVARHVAARVDVETELLHHTSPLRPGEAHGEEDELARQLEVTPGHGLEHRPTPVGAGICTRWPRQGAHRAVAVVDEPRRRHAVDPVPALFVGRGGAEDERPRGPGVVVGPGVGGTGQDLELVHERRPLAVGRSQAVGAGVAAADDDDALARRRDRRRVEGTLAHQVGRLQVLHGEVHPVEVAALHRRGRAARWPRRPAPRRRTPLSVTRPAPP